MEKDYLFSCNSCKNKFTKSEIIITKDENFEVWHCPHCVKILITKRFVK